MAGEVIVGYDGSACAKGALSQAVEQARAFGTGVVIAFAYEPPAMGPRWPTTATPSRSGARPSPPRRSAWSPAAGSRPPRPWSTPAPPTGLLALADQHQARMIVIGTHGERPLMGVVLGSTPYKLLHRSPVPVLVVPPDAEPERGPVARHPQTRRYPVPGQAWADDRAPGGWDVSQGTVRRLDHADRQEGTPRRRWLCWRPRSAAWPWRCCSGGGRWTPACCRAPGPPRAW